MTLVTHLEQHSVVCSIHACSFSSLLTSQDLLESFTIFSLCLKRCIHLFDQICYCFFYFILFFLLLSSFVLTLLELSFFLWNLSSSRAGTRSCELLFPLPRTYQRSIHVCKRNQSISHQSRFCRPVVPFI